MLKFVTGLFEELSVKIADSKMSYKFTCGTKDSANNLSALLKGQLVNLKAMVKGKLEAVKKPNPNEMWFKSASKYLTSNISLLIAKSVLKSARIDENGNDIGIELTLPKDLIPGLSPVTIGMVGVVAAIAIPNFKKARKKAQQRACFANQKVILGAIEMYNMDNSKNISEINVETIQTLVKGQYLRKAPKCPKYGMYKAVGDLSADGEIKCSIHGSVNYK